MKRKELRTMAERWPSTVVARSQVKTFTGGAFSGKTLANADSEGTGPKGRFKLGRSTVYPVTSLIVWLEEHAKCICGNKEIYRNQGTEGGSNA